MKKLFASVDTTAKWATLKVSCDPSDQMYQVGGSGAQYAGSPDILWNYVVFIQDTKKIWNRGIMYYCGDMSEVEQNLSQHTGDNNIHVTESDKTTWSNKQDSIDDIQTIRDNSTLGKTSVQSINVSNGEMNVTKNGMSATSFNVVQGINANDGSVSNGTIKINTNTATSPTNKIATMTDVNEASIVKWEDGEAITFKKGEHNADTDSTKLVFDSISKRIYLKNQLIGSNIQNVVWDNATKKLSITDINGNVSEIVLSDEDSGSLLSQLRLDTNENSMAIDVLNGTGDGSVSKSIADAILPMNGGVIIASKSGDVVTIKAGITQTSGKVVNASDADIVLAKIASTGSPADVLVQYLSGVNSNENVDLQTAITSIGNRVTQLEINGVEYLVPTSAATTPNGATHFYGTGTNSYYSGTLTATADTAGKIYICKTTRNANTYAQWVTVKQNNAYSWLNLSNATINLDGFIKTVTVNGALLSDSATNDGNISLGNVINNISGETALVDGSNEYISVSAETSLTDGNRSTVISSKIKTVNLADATDSNNGLVTAMDVKGTISDTKTIFRDWTESDIK